MLYVGPTGASGVFNVASLTTGTIAAHTNVDELAVVREERKIEANVESVMKVRPAGFICKFDLSTLPLAGLWAQSCCSTLLGKEAATRTDARMSK